MHNTSNNKHREAELANTIADILNTTDFSFKLFNEAMAREHRSLQQLWMKVIVNYIRFAASDAYRTDARNKASKDVAEQLNCTLNDMFVYLPFI